MCRPAEAAAAISPKLEMAWLARAPPRPETRLPSHTKATTAMAAHSKKKRR